MYPIRVSISPELYANCTIDHCAHLSPYKLIMPGQLPNFATARLDV